MIRRVLRVHTTETSRRVLPHVASRQELEVEMLAETTSFELANGLAQSRGAHDRVGRAIGADDQEPRGLGTLGDRSQQIHRGHIAPMEVLQHHHQGRLSGQALERVVELTRHPLPRGALDPALQPLELRALDRCGQLQEPHGCAIIEEPDQITAVGLGSQAPQGLQHRAVGLPGPEAHHTLGAHEGGLRSPGEALHEQLDKGGLPGPRLTCHEDELTPALVGFQEAIQSSLPGV
jgi:hypothetical protein